MRRRAYIDRAKLAMLGDVRSAQWFLAFVAIVLRSIVGASSTAQLYDVFLLHEEADTMSNQPMICTGWKCKHAGLVLADDWRSICQDISTPRDQI